MILYVIVSEITTYRMARFKKRRFAKASTSFCLEEPYILPPREVLVLRHRLYAVRADILDAYWRRFAETAYEVVESVGEMVARESRRDRAKSIG